MTKAKPQRIRKMNRKRVLISIVFTALIFTIINAFYQKIVINISDSHPGTIFWKTDKNPVKDDYVYFDFQHSLLLNSTKQILSKQLICTVGDQLKVGEKFISCNNKKYLIKRNKKTDSGKNIEQFYYQGVVPKNQAIVWGSNLESFDSRYWGFVDYNQLYVMKIIW